MERKFADELSKEYDELGKEFKALDAIQRANAKRMAEITEKRNMIRPLLVAYGASMVSGALESVKVLAAEGKKESTKAKVIRAVEAILADGVARSTKELLPMVEEAGIDLGGQNKLTYLAIILNKAGVFQSDRATGWTLKTNRANES